MKHTKTTLLTLCCVLVIAACGTDSSRSQATGKGSIRAINAIQTAPEVGFLIEEITIGSADYRQITTIASYDDLVYNFNFEAFFAGATTIDRFATQPLDVVADMDYILVLTGTIASPNVIVWEAPEREFTGTETVFEARFAHTADSMGSVDYYFAAPGVAPILGQQIGTLAFGDILTASDYATGDYVLIVTTSGNPADVLFESATSTFLGALQYTVTTFDGGPNTFAPIIARGYTQGAGGSAGTATLPDANFPATAEFINGSLALNTIDIYDDDMQTSRIVDDLAYSNVSAELNLANGDNVVHFTPFDLNNPVLIEASINFFRGLRSRVIGYGPVDNLQALSYLPDRRSVVTHAKLQFFNSATNFEFLTVFAIPANDVLDAQLPIILSLSSGNASAVIPFAAGSFDLYIREFNQTEVLAGPIRLDPTLGDVFGAIVFDTVDPAILDVQFLPTNP